jgi:hypothetical protein
MGCSGSAQRNSSKGKGWEQQMNAIVGIGYKEFECCSLDPNLKIIEIQRTTY